ncbi:RDD family protein [Kribbella sp. NBC_00709]|uniref:RDD family protein n=1 Tax=Kribbella sp. NBC_00709 TaxID=2975972 RepID=UPI002E2BE2E3|nr:RDD family protein [Kribbella sp. NBC_00709]
MSTPPPSGPYDGRYPPGQFPPQGYNPYGQGFPGGGYGYGYAPPGRLADWPIRVGASLLDSLIMAIPAIAGVLAALIIDGDQEELGVGGGIAMIGGFVVAFGVWVWNRIIQQGRTGQSFGKKVTSLRVVDAYTGQLIGMGKNLGREVCAQIFNQLCVLNVLWPLWDDKQQTWHDKVVNDIVVRT